MEVDGRGHFRFGLVDLKGAEIQKPESRRIAVHQGEFHFFPFEVRGVDEADAHIAGTGRVDEPLGIIDACQRRGEIHVVFWIKDADEAMDGVSAESEGNVILALHPSGRNKSSLFPFAPFSAVKSVQGVEGTSVSEGVITVSKAFF